MTRPLSIWLICDGKPGHENQSLGLAEAMARRTPCEIQRISVAGSGGLIGRIRGAMAAGNRFPKPDFIIGAGHKTHVVLLALARKHRAMSIVLMRPSLPMAWFGLCIAPSHDFPGGGDHPKLILTRGAMNRVRPEDGTRTGKLILIGGPSKTHAWEGSSLLEMLGAATDRGGWELTDSRRTPDGFLDQVRARIPGLAVFSHEQTPPDWVPMKLQQAKEVWVTEDSVSMIYEALTSGARVGLLPAPRLASTSRVLDGIDRLVADGYVTRFEDWQGKQRLADPPEVLNEADRCAEIILSRLL